MSAEIIILLIVCFSIISSFCNEIYNRRHFIKLKLRTLSKDKLPIYYKINKKSNLKNENVLFINKYRSISEKNINSKVKIPIRNNERVKFAIRFLKEYKVLTDFHYVFCREYGRTRLSRYIACNYIDMFDNLEIAASLSLNKKQYVKFMTANKEWKKLLIKKWG